MTQDTIDNLKTRIQDWVDTNPVSDRELLGAINFLAFLSAIESNMGLEDLH